MATILRIKRRRHDDPLDTVLVSCKKRKEEPEKDEDQHTDVQKFLKYAGTVSNKDANISRPIRDAIKKEKLEKEYKRHETNIPEKSRQQRKHAAKHGRFKITSSHRGIQLEDLDNFEKEQISQNEKTQSKSSDCPDAVISENVKEEENVCKNCGKVIKNENTSEKTANKILKMCVNCSQKTEHTQVAPNYEKVFQLYDVEVDQPQTFPDFNSILRESQNTSGITCNSVQLVRETVPDDNFVYDLYYTNNPDFNLCLSEDSLSIEAFTDVQYGDGNDDDDNDGLYDDEDDSNDESNWRNDYPDEDPQFYENADLDNGYDNGFDDFQAFGNYGDGELAEYMSARCNIEDRDELSSDDEDHAYFGEQMDPICSGAHNRLSYEQYYKMVRKEMEDDGGDDGDEEEEDEYSYKD
ncbi:hypothetical protein KUTeg_019869 [Tegillarca granosa]|uniref:Probable RNA polymerase II nuclear localization protein SLC7A6OS n=1 Tax=Tegillarca granosa TaxID=220873 RepID=A0ABQ9EDU8_TEGGR|nr:hypothetical protein KUTeg_019869 [Tegillarca granosa]